MLDHDAPLKRAFSPLSNDALGALLRALWSKLACVGDRALIQDESSPRLAIKKRPMG